MQLLNFADQNNFSTVLDFNARGKEILDLTQYSDQFKKKKT